jgi:8-oxo-dGTP diphosphatase
VENSYQHKVRVRVCGICLSENRQEILLIKHLGLGKDGVWWAPPGGGVTFGESAEEALVREFLEETGLQIKVCQFLFVNEFVKPPLHAVELFFAVEIIGGTLQKGHDPELSQQIISEVRFVSWEEISRISEHQLHGIFAEVANLPEILRVSGHRFTKN